MSRVINALRHMCFGLLLVSLWAQGPVVAGDTSCCTGHGEPGCDDAACSSIVCMFAPSCCSTEWDDVCAAIAGHACGACGDGGIAGGCDPCDPFGGCFDVLDCTCQITNPCDPDCNPVCNPLCPSQFDPCACSPGPCNPDCPQYSPCICFGLPPCVCNPCGPGCGGECNPACPQWDLCDCSPGPCNPDCPEYDECICAGLVCGCPTSGNCCEANGTPGCVDPTCCPQICGSDPFCCDTQWDQICADAAIATCFFCNPCLSDPCGPGCGAACNPDCREFDPCACAGIVCGCPTAGLCCEPDDKPGCVDPICCEQVCSLDAFCCEVVWDALCADVATETCFFCGAFCGDEGQPACPCEQVLCCDDGLGQDPPGVGLCSACSSVTPSYYCNHDGRGQEGEPSWLPGSIEYLRTTFTCDRGLGFDVLSGTCVNVDRHRSDVAAFGTTWTSRALALQRRLANALPFTQCQFLGSHNSYSTAVDEAFLYEHSYSLSDQLDMGIRWLGFDVHWSDQLWQNGPFPDLRLSHASSDHFGMTPMDRPYRHGVEELARWIDTHPGEVVVLSIENRAETRSNELLPPLEEYLGSKIFRPSHLAQFGGVWHNVSPNDVLGLGKRLVVLGGGDTASLVSAAPTQDTIHLGVASGPSWTEDGNNGIKAFYDPSKGYMYDPATQTAGLSSDPFVFSQFTGDPSAFSCDQFYGVCFDSCDALCDIFPAACQDCWKGCSECNEPQYDGPGVFGITSPDTIGPMLEAGVNVIELCPVGQANAGITGGYTIIEEPFQPVMAAAVWSWNANEPPVNSQPKAAVAVLTGPNSVRFVSAPPQATFPYVAQGPTGACWKLTLATGPYSNGTAAVLAEYPDSSFTVPASGLMMRRLADAMVEAGVNAAWVHYHDLDGDNNWLANVSEQKAAPPVGAFLTFDEASDVAKREGFSGFPTTDITVAMWVKTSTAANSGIFSYAVAGQSNEFLVVSPENVTVYVKGGANLQSGVSITDGKWHHVAVTRSTTASPSGITRIYIDGVRVAEAVLSPAAPLASGGTVVLGHDQDCLGGCLDQHLVGVIDDVTVWHVARQPDEIIQAMGTPPNPEHRFLSAYWPMDDGSGAVAQDAAGTRDLLLSNGSMWGQYTLCGKADVVLGDLNGDGQVTPVDLGILLGAWGPCGGQGCPADLNGDGNVGPADLAILLGAWS